MQGKNSKLIPNLNFHLPDLNPYSEHRFNFKSAQVNLKFSCSPEGQTYLSRQLAGYPFHAGRILKKFNAAEGMATLLLQCTSGGLFEHDNVEIQLYAESGSMAHVGNAAATVVHSMTSGHARLRVQLISEANAYIEYLSNLTILFPDAHLVNEIEVTMHPNSISVITEAYSSHDPSYTGLTYHRLDSSMSVYNAEGEMLVRDRFLVTREASQQNLVGVYASFDTQGSMFVLMPGCDKNKIEKLTNLLFITISAANIAPKLAYIGVGALPNSSGAIVRILSNGSEAIRDVINKLILAVRQQYAIPAKHQDN